MALKSVQAKSGNSDGENFEIPSAGQQVACLVAIIDMGTQEKTYQGTVSKKHCVYFGWELLEEKKKDGKPFLIGTDYTASLATNSKLRPMIEGWLGKTFNDDEKYPYFMPVIAAKKGDPVGLLGKYCLLTIEHKKTTKDKDFATIKSVVGVPKQMQDSAKGLKPQIKPFSWEVETKELPALAEEVYLFGQKLSHHIAAAEERRGQGTSGTSNGQPRQPVQPTQPSQATQSATKQAANAAPANDEDIPF